MLRREADTAGCWGRSTAYPAVCLGERLDQQGWEGYFAGLTAAATRNEDPLAGGHAARALAIVAIEDASAARVNAP